MAGRVACVLLVAGVWLGRLLTPNAATDTDVDLPRRTALTEAVWEVVGRSELHQ